MARRKTGGRFSVTGPNLDKPVETHSREEGLQRCITEACRRNAPLDGTWYVRDFDEAPVSRVETHDIDGEKEVLVYGVKHYAKA